MLKRFFYFIFIFIFLQFNFLCNINGGIDPINYAAHGLEKEEELNKSEFIENIKRKESSSFHKEASNFEKNDNSNKKDLFFNVFNNLLKKDSNKNDLKKRIILKEKELDLLKKNNENEINVKVLSQLEKRDKFVEIYNLFNKKYNSSYSNLYLKDEKDKISLLLEYLEKSDPDFKIKKKVYENSIKIINNKIKENALIKRILVLSSVGLSIIVFLVNN